MASGCDAGAAAGSTPFVFVAILWISVAVGWLLIRAYERSGRLRRGSDRNAQFARGSGLGARYLRLSGVKTDPEANFRRQRLGNRLFLAALVALAVILTILAIRQSINC